MKSQFYNWYVLRSVRAKGKAKVNIGFINIYKREKKQQKRLR